MPARLLSSKIDPPRDIRDVLMFRIARLATIGDRTGQSRLSGEFGLSLGEWRVLGVICARPPITLAELAGELYLDKGQLSRTVSVLIDGGLVEPSPGTHDRRRTLFEPTVKGRRLHKKVLEFAFTRHSEWMGALNPSERSEFIRLLDKVTATAAQSYENLFALQGPRGAEMENSTRPRRISKKGVGASVRAGEPRNIRRASVRAAGS